MTPSRRRVSSKHRKEDRDRRFVAVIGGPPSGQLGYLTLVASCCSILCSFQSSSATSTCQTECHELVLHSRRLRRSTIACIPAHVRAKDARYSIPGRRRPLDSGANLNSTRLAGRPDRLLPSSSSNPLQLDLRCQVRRLPSLDKSRGTVRVLYVLYPYHRASLSCGPRCARAACLSPQPPGRYCACKAMCL